MAPVRTSLTLGCIAATWLVPLTAGAYSLYDSDIRRIDNSLQNIERGITEYNTQIKMDKYDQTVRRAMGARNTSTSASCPTGYKLQDTSEIDRRIKELIGEGLVKQSMLDEELKSLPPSMRMDAVYNRMAVYGETIDNLMYERSERLQTCVKLSSSKKKITTTIAQKPSKKKTTQRTAGQTNTADVQYSTLSKTHAKLSDGLGTSRRLAATYDGEWRTYLDRVLDNMESVIADMKPYVGLAKKRALTDQEYKKLSALIREYETFSDMYRAGMCTLEPSAGYCGK